MPNRAASWTFIGRALRSRNYRLFFSGQSISLIGTWMTRLATGWLVYRLTGSSVLLGTVSFAGQVPAFWGAASLQCCPPLADHSDCSHTGCIGPWDGVGRGDAGGAV